jgi:hypothetical protein
MKSVFGFIRQITAQLPSFRKKDTKLFLLILNFLYPDCQSIQFQSSINDFQGLEAGERKIISLDSIIYIYVTPISSYGNFFEKRLQRG